MSEVQLPLALKQDAGATLEGYYPGANQGALEQVRAVIHRPTWLYLWGAEGTGKTHLLNATCHHAGAQGRATCLLPLAQHERITPELLDGLHGLHLVCLDDLHAVAGDRQWEEALFYLLNRLRWEGTSVLMAGRSKPSGLHWSLPDLKSRLAWGTLVKLHGLSDEEKIQALQLRAKARGFDLPQESAIWLMRRVARDTRTLMRILEELDTASLQAQRRVTVPFLREVLQDRDAEPDS